MPSQNYCLLTIFSVWIHLVSSSNTRVSISGTNFQINGVTTYSTASNSNVHGILLNSRMIQGIFDDANTSTVNDWDYPDTHKWDPTRNTREFVGNMSLWNSYGLLAFTVGLQGGGPDPAYPRPQTWLVSTFDYQTGALDPNFISRLQTILDEADKLAMVPIINFFYAAQVNHFNKNNEAINASISNIIDWIITNEYNNILVDVCNECDGSEFEGTILYCSSNMSLTIPNIRGYILAKYGKTSQDLGIFFGSSTNSPPEDDLISASDFVIMHGNGKNVTEMQSMIDTVTSSPSYKASPKPIVYNEDPNTNFGASVNNMEVAIKNHCSWGYYEQGTNDYQDGYQSPPVAWDINTSNKQNFFNQVKMYST